jgi:hypothetical protein
MVDPISTSTAGTVRLTPQPGTTSTENVQNAVASAKTGTGDTVELTITAQIKNLRQQGQNVNEIALQLGMDTRTISFLLGEDA